MSPDTTKCVECTNNNKSNTCAPRRDATLKCDYFERKECDHSFNQYGFCEKCTINASETIDPKAVDWKAKYKVRDDQFLKLAIVSQNWETKYHTLYSFWENINEYNEKLKKENKLLRNIIITRLLKEQADE